MEQAEGESAPAELMSVRAAAAQLGVSTQRVHQLIKDGRLPVQRVGHSYVLRAADVRAGPRPSAKVRARGAPLVKCHVWLRPDQVERLRALGHGRLGAGLRVLLDQTAHQNAQDADADAD